MISDVAYHVIEKIIESDLPEYFLPEDTPINNIPGDGQDIYVAHGQIRIKIDIDYDGQLRSTWVDYINDNGQWVDMNFSQEFWIKIHRFLEQIWIDCPNKKIAIGEMKHDSD